MNNAPTIKKKVVRKMKFKSKVHSDFEDIVNFTKSNNLLKIYTKFAYIEGKKTPCYVGKIKNGDGTYIFSPNLGVPFYKWNKEMVRKHNTWLKDNGKLTECDGVIIILYNTNFIMVDTDDEEAENFVKGIKELQGAPITKSLTKPFGRHRYIKITGGGNYTPKLKINGKELDIITEYAFEGLKSKVENIGLVCEMPINTFNTMLNIEMEEKDLEAEEKIIRKHNNSKDKSFRIKDKIRNDFLNEDETIPKSLLIPLMKGLDVNKFNDYKNWFRLLCGLHNQALNMEDDCEYMALFCDFMNTSDNAKSGWFSENIRTWKDITNKKMDKDKMVKSGSLWKYLQEQNIEEFVRLKSLRRNQIDPPSFNKIKDFRKQKEIFERDCCVIRTTYCEMDNVLGELQEYSVDKFKLKFCNLKTIKTEENNKGQKVEKMIKFVDKWEMDDYRRSYDRMDFIPPPLIANPYTYNLYDGMFIDDIDDKEFDEMNEEERIEKCERILTHLYYLSGCDNKTYEFLLKIFAYKLKFPAILHKISVVMRSEQGCGKNAFLDWFGNKILGQKYYACSANADDFVGKFNSLTKGKLLVVFNEMDGQIGYAHSARLKEFATEETITHEKKNVDRTKVKNCMLTCYASNNKNPVKVEIGDRRFFVMECSTKVLYIPNYFEDLFADLDDPCVAKCFTWYLREVVNVAETYNFKINRPITRTYKNLQNRNKSPIVKFASWFINKHDIKKGNRMNELWERYCEFAEYTRAKNKLDYEGFNNCLSDYIYYCSEEELGSRDFKKIVRKTKNGVMVYRFSVARTKYLVSLYDTDADLVFSDEEKVSEDEEEFIDSD